MTRLLPAGPHGENTVAVHVFRRLDAALDLVKAGPLKRRLRRQAAAPHWPRLGGDYRVGDPGGSVAVCTLSSPDLNEPVSRLPGVAIAGRLVTVNLGIERMVRNVLGNPAIRSLVLCGRDSPVFHTAQAVRALVERGVTDERRILGAQGHWPVLGNLTPEQIEGFRHRIRLVDATGTSDLHAISRLVAAAAKTPSGPRAAPEPAADAPSPGMFTQIPAGGDREPLGRDPRGFFVITLDREAGAIVCQHYSEDCTPAHEIRSRSAERILRGLLRADLVSRLSHAGYLGAELARAEAALRLGLIYEQDKALRARE